jgi:signal transduction histidine kinase
VLVQHAIQQGRPYAVVFVDMRMPPGWDGVETLEHLWRIDPALQAVICTAFADLDWDYIIQRLGHSDQLLILRKPFDVVEVWQLARALTQKWSLAKHARHQLDTLAEMVDQRTQALREVNARLQRDIARRQQVEEALRHSEAHYRLLTEAVPGLVWMDDADNQNRYVNRYWGDYTGQTSAETQGHGWQAALHPYDRAATQARQRARQATTMAEPPQWDPQGQLCGWLGTGIDIDDRKQAELALQEQAQDLTRSNTDLQVFAYIASHDLQEPLRTVTSFVQLLQRRLHGRLDAETTEFMTYIVDGVARMQALLTALLTYTRVRTTDLAFAPTVSAALVDEVLADLRASIIEHGAVVTRDALPTVRADATQLRLVFQNLLSNALKFRGADPPRIHLAARREAHAWVFTVQDNGIGLEAQYAERIFQAFQRLHPQSTYPGAGIGLAICKRIVERHGGRIWAESVLGHGTTFAFTLPAEHGDRAAEHTGGGGGRATSH